MNDFFVACLLVFAGGVGFYLGWGCGRVSAFKEALGVTEKFKERLDAIVERKSAEKEAKGE